MGKDAIRAAKKETFRYVVNPSVGWVNMSELPLGRLSTRGFIRIENTRSE